MLKAIIIDDEILSIELIEYMLRKIGGIEVVASCVNPLEGLALAAELRPDIVVLDIQMPAKNGIDVAHELISLHADIHIIFTTAYEQFALEAFQVRAVDYILKPIDIDRLKATIDIIQARRPAAASAAPAAARPATPPMKAQFLETFILFNDAGEPLKWRTKKVKELCAYLLHHQHPVYREQIIEDLWPDIDTNRALHYLHMGVYQIRKTLKDTGRSDTVRFVNDCYSLSVHMVSDTHLLQQAFNASADSRADIETALGLYTGDYLEREHYMWAMHYREQLHNGFKRKLEQYVQVNSTAHTSPLFRTCMEKLIQLDPLREDYAAQYMQALLADNRKAEAARAYRQHAERLWDELKETPKSALTTLAEQAGIAK